jgi:hypothetical protein
MQTQELDRIRYITQTYEALKGLRLVPIGLFIIITSFRQLGWTGLGEQGDCTYTLPLFAVALALYIIVDQYYQRSFGTVRVSKNTPLLPILALLGIFFTAVALEIGLKTSVSLVGLAIGALLIYSGVITRRFYYMIAGAAMLAVSLVPFFLPTAVSGKPFSTFGFWWNMLIGATWIVLGLLDHWKLVQAMKPVQGEVDDRPE